MTLYYVLVFVLLILETLSFLVLILPFPRKWRRKTLTWIKESNLVAQTKWTLKFVFAFIGLLFLESNDNSLADAMTEASHAAKRFYNQRNMYLTGFTLFLTL
nr:15321_t:CDS:2 [Entrophospora candida]